MKALRRIADELRRIVSDKNDDGTIDVDAILTEATRVEMQAEWLEIELDKVERKAA